MYHLTKAEVEADPSMVEGTFLIHTTPVHALVDPGATHSFMAIISTKSLGLEPSGIGYRVKIYSLIGRAMEASHMICCCDVEVTSEKFETNLILIDM